MIRLVKLITIMTLLCLTAVAANAQTLNATMNGASVVPGPGDPDGSGFAVITISGTSINYSVLASAVATPTNISIVSGAAGQAATPLVTLTGSGTLFGSVTATQAQIDQILADPGSYAVVVSNSEFPNGAIRGQLSAVSVGGGETTLWFPVVAKSQGAAGTNFTSDLRIVNTGSSVATVQLQFFATSAGGQSAPTATAQVTVAPGEQKVLNDVVGTTLAANGLGALRLVSDQPIQAAVRVINDLRASGLGTSGLAVQGLAPGDASTSGLLPLLSNTSVADINAGIGFRTNLGYLNPGTSSVTATLVARASSNGAILGTKTITIPGRAFVQQGVFQLIDTVPGAQQVQQDFYVTYNSSGPIFVYGATVDNKTGDSVYVQ